MNSTGNQMLEILKELVEEDGCVAVKAEFEAEGSRTDELIMLCDVVNRLNVPLTVKIGGCEAVRDLDQCKLLGVKGIMAPMVETPFAMSKFKSAAEKVYGDDIDTIEWIVNTETKTCHDNLGDILKAGEGFLDMIGIGRVDYSGSLGLPRAEINSEAIKQAVTDMATQAKSRGLAVAFGGGISFEAIPFIQSMASCCDRFETRKVHFVVTDNAKRLKKGILNAMRFEKLYLENKCNYYDLMANEDRARLAMMDSRIKQAEEVM